MTRRTRFFVFFFTVLRNVTARNVIISSNSLLVEEMERSSVGGGELL